MTTIDTPVFLMGDTHGSTKVLAEFLSSHSGVSIILMGDSALGFQQGDMELLEGLAKDSGNHLYAIRGNHDNPSLFIDPPQGEFLHLLQDYSELILNGRRALAVGGAVSIDRTFRILGRSWWQGEALVWDADRVASLAGQVDILLTHAGVQPPSMLPLNIANPGLFDRDPDLRFDLPQERNLLLDLIDHLQPAEWYFGHYHVSEAWQLNDRTRCRVLDIDEIVELNFSPSGLPDSVC